MRHPVLEGLFRHGARYPDGRERRYRGAAPGPEAAMALRTRRAVRRLVTNPALAAGERAMAGAQEPVGCAIHDLLDVRVANLWEGGGGGPRAVRALAVTGTPVRERTWDHGSFTDAANFPMPPAASLRMVARREAPFAAACSHAGVPLAVQIAGRHIMPITASTIPVAPILAIGSSDTYDLFAFPRFVGFELQAGNVYEFDADGTLGDVYLRLFDQLGNEVRANDDGADDGEILGLDAYIRYAPEYSGTYYIGVSNIETTGYDPFNTAGIDNPDNFIPSAVGTLFASLNTFFSPFPEQNDTATARNDTRLLATEDRQARLTYDDFAFVGSADPEIGRFDLEKNDRIFIDVNGLFPGNSDPVDTTLRIFNAGGSLLATDGAAGIDAELLIAAQADGAIFIGVSGEGNDSYLSDGSATFAGDSGSFRVIIHLNPDLVGQTFVADRITDAGGSTYIIGASGNDTLTGAGGEDTLAGGDDNDSLDGGADNDILHGELDDDLLVGGRGNDVLNGNEGNDDLAGGSGGDLIAGGEDNDTATGGNGNDTIRGDAGADELLGNNGSDYLLGGTANDTLSGNTGADTLDGGDGSDSLRGNDGNDSILGGAGNDVARGDAGNDTIDGGSFADNIRGDDGNDLLVGGSEADTIDGDAGNDLLQGDTGADALVGDIGDDTLVGGGDSDSLTGGAGADRFVFNFVSEGVDQITDFTLGEDVIDLSAIFFGQGVTAANLANFVQITPAGAGSDSFLAVDANGLTGGLSFTIIALVDDVAPATLFDIDNFLV